MADLLLDVAKEECIVSPLRIDIPRERVAEFCRRHRVIRLSLFGSVLREDFRSESDVDVLVSFAADAR